MAIDLEAMERRAIDYSKSNFGGRAWGFPKDVLTLIARVRELEAQHDCGLSWSVFILRGDRESIDEVKRLIHRDGRCADLESIVRGLDASVAAERKRYAAIAREHASIAAGNAMLTGLEIAESIATAIERDAGSDTGTEK